LSLLFQNGIVILLLVIEKFTDTNFPYYYQIQELLELRTIPPPKPAIPAMRLFAIVGIVVAGVTIISTIYH
jgi:hypothetical protein